MAKADAAFPAVIFVFPFLIAAVLIVPFSIFSRAMPDSAVLYMRAYASNLLSINNFWDYPKNCVKFFTQGKLPIISVDKKLILQDLSSIKEASNGNGDVFISMKKHGILDELKEKNIKWVSFGGIDNILLKNVDTFFLGLAINKNYSIASKSILKNAPCYISISY